MANEIRSIEAKGRAIVLLPVSLAHSVREMDVKDLARVVVYPDGAGVDEIQELLRAAARSQTTEGIA